LAYDGIPFAKFIPGLHFASIHEDPGMFSKNSQATAQRKTAAENATISREQLIFLLNEDLAREYQAVIGYVVYSQILKGAAYMSIAQELEGHAKQELDHALIIAKQIDYLGGEPAVAPVPVKTATDAQEILRIDLANENETVRNYRERILQCEQLGEYALAEQIRKILVQEQEHQIDLATALGMDVVEAASAEELV
jgi:bacterioferritin